MSPTTSTLCEVWLPQLIDDQVESQSELKFSGEFISEIGRAYKKLGEHVWR